MPLPAVAAEQAGTPAEAALCCDRCGHTPTDPMQKILMSAQWLIPGPDGPALARYCRACPPAGPITDLTCGLCGDGPLLVGDLAVDPAVGPDGDLPAPARAWLTTAGWRLAPSTPPICPHCRPVRPRAGDPA